MSIERTTEGDFDQHRKSVGTSSEMIQSGLTAALLILDINVI